MPNEAGDPGEAKYYRDIARAFRIMAPFYDFGTAVIGGVRERVADFALGSAGSGAGKGARVLDVATGTGKQAFAFARRGCDVVGLDLSPDMLRVAVRKNRYPNARFQVGDATALPFPDATFDIACISFGLHEMPTAIRERAVPELARVTRPGGMVLVVDYALPYNRLGRAVIYRIIKTYEGKHYVDFVHSDVAGLLAKNGINVVEKLRLLVGAAVALKGTKGGDTSVPKSSSSGTRPLPG